MIHAPSAFRPPRVPSAARGAKAAGSTWCPAAWAALLALAAAGGCRDAPTTPEPPDIESLEFAPELEVDISRMTRLPSGLYIRDVVEGTGARAEPQVGAQFNYQGWLHDGTSVDMGIYPANQFSPGAFLSPFDGEVYYHVGSGQTIAAWDLGLEGMRIGGRRQLVVPPRLAFGGAGSSDGRVPGNAVLVYVLELLAVEP